MIRLAVIVIAAVSLSACSTVRLPDLGMEMSEFRESLDRLDDNYIQADELPSRPTDIRSAAEFDRAATDMIRLRDGFTVPEGDAGLSDAEFDAAYQAAQDYADAYKDDDPQ